jgi:predicted DNA-binding protein
MKTKKTVKRISRNVRISPECLERLTLLAEQIGSRHPMTLAGEILETVSRLEPSRYHSALATLHADLKTAER